MLIIYLIQMYLREGGNTRKPLSAASTCPRTLVPLAAICMIVHWLVHDVPAADGASALKVRSVVKEKVACAVAAVRVRGNVFIRHICVLFIRLHVLCVLGWFNFKNLTAMFMGSLWFFTASFIKLSRKRFLNFASFFMKLKIKAQVLLLYENRQPLDTSLQI